MVDDDLGLLGGVVQALQGPAAELARVGGREMDDVAGDVDGRSPRKRGRGTGQGSPPQSGLPTPPRRACRLFPGPAGRRGSWRAAAAPPPAPHAPPRRAPPAS